MWKDRSTSLTHLIHQIHDAYVLQSLATPVHVESTSTKFARFEISMSIPHAITQCMQGNVLLSSAQSGVFDLDTSYLLAVAG